MKEQDFDNSKRKDYIFEVIKKIAKKRNLSLQEVAIKAGLGKNTLYKWQYQAPRESSVEKVSKVLGIDSLGLLFVSAHDLSREDLTLKINKCCILMGKLGFNDDYIKNIGDIMGNAIFMNKEKLEQINKLSCLLRDNKNHANEWLTEEGIKSTFDDSYYDSIANKILEDPLTNLELQNKNKGKDIHNKDNN